MGDAPAHFNRTARLESAICVLPGIPAAGVYLEVDIVELFNDVFDFVRDELDRILKPGEVDVNRHDYAVLAFHRRARVI